MGDFKRNGQLFIVMEDGSFRALQHLDTIETLTPYDPNFKTTVKGYNISMNSIDTDFLVAAIDNLNKIIEERKKEEIKKIESWLTDEPFTLNKHLIGYGYAPIRPDEKHKAMYERYKALKPELFESKHCGCKINYLALDEYKKQRDDSVDALTTLILATSKLPKLDPDDNSFIKRLENNNIWINNKKKVVTVKKPDGSVIKVKCDQRDEFDPYVGTALALAYKEFGSKSKFRKYVDELLAKQNKKDKKKGE